MIQSDPLLNHYSFWVHERGEGVNFSRMGRLMSVVPQQRSTLFAVHAESLVSPTQPGASRPSFWRSAADRFAQKYLECWDSNSLFVIFFGEMGWNMLKPATRYSCSLSIWPSTNLCIVWVCRAERGALPSSLHVLHQQNSLHTLFFAIETAQLHISGWMVSIAQRQVVNQFVLIARQFDVSWATQDFDPLKRLMYFFSGL